MPKRVAALLFSLWPILGLLLFALFYTWDLFTLKRYLDHAEYVHYYFAFRHWFLENLLSGHFPQWNPYWGIGDTAQIETSFPIDIYSFLELLVGPKYHLFYPLQAALILGAGYWALRKLKFSVGTVVLMPILFILSPWVRYFFLYFIKANSFIGLLISFPLAVAWFRGRHIFSLYGFAWATVFTLFGTKMEFWFFHCIYFLSLGIAGSVIWSRENRFDKKAFAYFLTALGFGILCHAWQIVPLLQILSHTGRLENPPGLSSFLHMEIYEKLFLSITESFFLKTLVVSLLAVWASLLRGQQALLASFLTLLVGLILVPTDHKGWSYLLRPFGAGAFLAFLFSVFQNRKNGNLQWLPHFRGFALFFPLALYWCRTEPSDLHEMIHLHSISIAHAVCLGALLMWGSLALETRKIPRLCFFLITILFLMRDQGQILMAYLKGFMWIPTRDSYLFDWTFVVLFAVGLESQLKKRALAVSLVATLAIILSLPSNLFSIHPLVKETPEGYPFYLGAPKLREVLATLPDFPPPRAYMHDHETIRNLSAMGSSLLEGKNQVLGFSSLLASRYRDWNVFQWYGIRPEQQWAGYEAEYTEKTIAKLPKRQNLGFHNDVLYLNTLYAFPPADPRSLKLLGVTHVVQPNPPLLLPGLKNYRFLKHYTVAEMSDSLPRVFSFPLPSAGKLRTISQELGPKFEKGILTFKDFQVSTREEKLLRYEPERVLSEVSSKEESVFVLTDLFHPFWRAFVDGRPEPVTPALYLFRSVVVPPGKHTVEFRCEIPFLAAARTLSVSLLFVLLALPLLIILLKNVYYLRFRRKTHVLSTN
jgi:hypothetical protein